MRATCSLLLLLGAALAQEKKPDARPEALPAGQQRKLQAVAMEVTGTVQWRASAKDAWKPLRVNDLLEAGAEVRTGRDSRAVLRAGMNGTIEVDRQSRLAIPELVQEGATLKTRVAMTFGKAELKVDKVGLDNDFEVSTPTATLAVKGTTSSIRWDVVNGFQARGAPGNRLRAIEIRFLGSIVNDLTDDDETDDRTKLPVRRAFLRTFFLPLPGEWDNDSIDHIAQLGPRKLRHLFTERQLKILKKLRDREGGQENPTGNLHQAGPPTGP